MDKVTIDKNMLLEKVKNNRKEHVSSYEDAIEGYRKKVSEKLTHMLALANKNKDVDFAELYHLAKPESHAKEYDRVINMISMHTQTEVELTNRDFGRYVEDDWEWKAQFMATNSIYNG